MKRRVYSIILLFATLITATFTLPVDVYAIQNENNQSTNEDMAEYFGEAHNFSESYGECDYISKKIDEEVANNTNLISDEVEEYLNKNGVFDAEIQNFDEDTLEELKNDDDIDNYCIMTEIYAVNDSEELAGTPIGSEEQIKLTDEQVDKYFAQEYFNEETDLSEEISEQFEKMNSEVAEENVAWFEKMGIESIEAKAGEKYALKEFDKGGGDTSYLKKILILKKYKTSHYVKVIYQTEWETMPKNRYMDCSVLRWDGRVYWSSADPQMTGTDNITVRHYWTPFKTEKYFQGIYTITVDTKLSQINSMIPCAGYKKNSSDPYEYNLLKYMELVSNKSTFYETEQYVIGESAIFIFLDLQLDKAPYSYVREGVIASFYLHIESEISCGPTFYTKYFHTWITKERDTDGILSGIIQIAVSGENIIGITVGVCKFINGLSASETLKWNESGVGLAGTLVYDYKYK